MIDNLGQLCYNGVVTVNHSWFEKGGAMEKPYMITAQQAREILEDYTDDVELITEEVEHPDSTETVKYHWHSLRFKSQHGLIREMGTIVYDDPILPSMDD